MESMDDKIDFNEAYLDAVKFVNSGAILNPHIAEDSIDVRLRMEHQIRAMMIDFVTFRHGVLDKKISVHRKWPANWWEAVKERWAPRWCKRRWPVQYERVDVEENAFKSVCPHVPAAPKGAHLRWVAGFTESFLSPQQREYLTEIAKTWPPLIHPARVQRVAREILDLDEGMANR